MSDVRVTTYVNVCKPSANAFHAARTHARAHAQVAGREVIVRVQASEEAVFDRAQELAASQRAAATGLGPQLLAIFGNGRVEVCLSEYTTATASDLRRAAVLEHVAVAMAAFHTHMVRDVWDVR